MTGLRTNFDTGWLLNIINVFVLCRTMYFWVYSHEIIFILLKESNCHHPDRDYSKQLPAQLHSVNSHPSYHNITSPVMDSNYYPRSFPMPPLWASITPCASQTRPWAHSHSPLSLNPPESGCTKTLWKIWQLCHKIPCNGSAKGVRLRLVLTHTSPVDLKPLSHFLSFPDNSYT